jgi:hypothetical protein
VHFGEIKENKYHHCDIKTPSDWTVWWSYAGDL